MKTFDEEVVENKSEMLKLNKCMFAMCGLLGLLGGTVLLMFIFICKNVIK